ncbi:hypothetical protein ABIA39_007822 [Nocardia sp. GAS34]
MLVVVTVVARVPMPVVDVIDVIAMGDSGVATPLAMDVLVIVVRGVASRFAFVVVTVVGAVQVAVVHIVGVPIVRNSDMPTTVAVCVFVLDVSLMLGHGHDLRSFLVPLLIRLPDAVIHIVMCASMRG